MTMIRRFTAFLLAAVLLCGLLPASTAGAEPYGTRRTEETSRKNHGNTDIQEILTPEQRAAIAMLNYMAVMSERIRSATHSRLVLEDVYNELVNNLNPDQVSAQTLAQVKKLTDVIETYRATEQKRLRTRYELEQALAARTRKAISAALQNDSSVIKDTFKDIREDGKEGGNDPAGNPLKALSSLTKYNLILQAASMLTRGYFAWQQATGEAEMTALGKEWALDDAEMAALHDQRITTFGYMVDTVTAYGLQGSWTLNEEAVQALVHAEKDPSLRLRVQFLESEEETYRNYGGYWLLLARSYYGLGEWQACLDAVERYLALDIHIFRKDHELAQVMPLAIEAVSALAESDADFIANAAPYLEILCSQSTNNDWQLRFCAALACLDFCERTPDTAMAERRRYFDQAYGILSNALPHLVWEQQRLNAAWIAPVPAPGAGLTQAQQAEYNSLTALRKTELPPVYEPLYFCLLVLRTMQHAASDSFVTRAQELDEMLHPGNARLFWNEYRESESWFSRQAPAPKPASWSLSTRDTVRYAFAGGYQYDPLIISIPVTLISEDTRLVLAAARTGYSAGAAVFTDARLVEVRRSSGQPTEWLAIFRSSALERKTEAYAYQETKKKPISLDLAWRLQGEALPAQAWGMMHLGYGNKESGYRFGSYYYGSHLPYYRQSPVGFNDAVGTDAAARLLALLPEALANTAQCIELRPLR